MQLNFEDKDALFDDNSTAIDDDDDDFADIANPVKIQPNLTNDALRTTQLFFNPTQQNQEHNNNNNNNVDDDDNSMSNVESKQSVIWNESEKLDPLMKLDNLHLQGYIICDYNLTSKLLDIKNRLIIYKDQ